MRNKIFITLLAVLLLVTGVGGVMVKGEAYPYELKNYRDLNLDDADRCNFSPDGRLIVFYSDAEQPDMSSIWVANSDGTERRLVYRSDSIGTYFTSAKFHPSGNKILFWEESISILEQNDTEWNDNITITRLQGKGGVPSCSSDGTQIIYLSGEGGGVGDVWVMDIDGTNRTQLTFDKDGGDNPSYSPDGKKILYERRSDNGESEIWLMNANGTEKKMVLDDSWYSSNPTFMPDGKILFASGRVSPHSKKVGIPSIWMMEQDGSNQTLLIPNWVAGPGSIRPAISPDGTQIIFQNGLGDSFHLYVVEDPDGDGEWEDSDGDHVADICDGYPDDPDRGYYKDDDEQGFFLPRFRVGVVAVSILVAVPVVVWWRKR